MGAGGYVRRRVAVGATRSVSLPAPIGGVNTADSASAMPPTDAVYAYNVIRGAQGLEVRSGYEEWATGLPSAPLTVLAFTGNAQSFAADKLFVACAQGIYDVTASGVAPTLVMPFVVTTGRAGRGQAIMASSPAGRFLVYCDEENGLHTYNEGGAWIRVAGSTAQPWEAGVSYEVGNRVVNEGAIYQCDQPGRSDPLGTGPSGTSADIIDGATRWDYVQAAFSNVIGPGLADQQLGNACDPGRFVFGAVWGSRLWFVEKATTRAWYLDVNSVYGPATSFDFGTKMQHGGPLRALYSWSYDAGAGLQQLLVAISDAGDVVAYGGSDPSSADTFSLRGSWFVGGLPAGRHIASESAGELLLITKLGLLSGSKLIAGGQIEDSKIYATRKISPTFAALTETFGIYDGWAAHVHPTDNALIVLVPQAATGDTIQWAYSFLGEGGWFQYRGLPMTAAAVWSGRLFFGTSDGRVCVNEGDLDDVKLADPNSYSPVEWSVLPAYQTLGTADWKRVHLVRPVIISEAPLAPLGATPRFEYDLSEPPAPSGAVSLGGALWDVARWDQAKWGGQGVAGARITGGLGIGRAVSVAVRGSSTGRTVLAEVGIGFDTGGLL